MTQETLKLLWVDISISGYWSEFESGNTGQYSYAGLGGVHGTVRVRGRELNQAEWATLIGASPIASPRASHLA